MLINKKIKKIKTESRVCQCCNGSDLELLWTDKGNIVRRRYIWELTVNISICRTCGFCFSSPGPINTELMKYYEDGNVGFKEIGLPYSIEKRIRILSKYKKPRGIFVEIGGDGPGEFHQRCKKYFNKMFSVEITKELKRKSCDIKSMRESVDVLTHYDVLEHVSNVKKFLCDCYNALKINGVMVCEVPNIKRYPKNLLLQELEHINHFSISSLSKIAQNIGFTLIEYDLKASRPHGFVAVFKKTQKKKISNEKYINEYASAKKWILGGIKQIKKNEEKILLVKSKINKLSKNNKKIIIWGVTDLLRSLIKNLEINENLTIVDSDPRRKNDLILDKIEVEEPRNTIDKLRKADLLIICAPRYSNEILNWIKVNVGREFFGDMLNVIGVNASGKTLR